MFRILTPTPKKCRNTHVAKWGSGKLLDYEQFSTSPRLNCNKRKQLKIERDCGCLRFVRETSSPSGNRLPTSTTGNWLPKIWKIKHLIRRKPLKTHHCLISINNQFLKPRICIQWNESKGFQLEKVSPFTKSYGTDVHKQSSVSILPISSLLKIYKL